VPGASAASAWAPPTAPATIAQMIEQSSRHPVLCAQDITRFSIGSALNPAMAPALHFCNAGMRSSTLGGILGHRPRPSPRVIRATNPSSRSASSGLPSDARMSPTAAYQNGFPVCDRIHSLWPAPIYQRRRLSRADIEHRGVHRVPSHAGNSARTHIGDIDEIAGLAAVAEDRDAPVPGRCG